MGRVGEWATTTASARRGGASDFSGPPTPGASSTRRRPGWRAGLPLLAAVLLAAGGCSGGLAPSDGAPLSVTRLKYVLDVRWTIFFCDPDYYPIARGDELQAAVEHFPAIAADTERYSAILEHLVLASPANPSDSTKLRIYREDKRLASIILTGAGDGYAFQLREQEAKGAVFSVSGTVDRFGNVDVSSRTASYGGCPICLAGDTRIATPAGEVAVRSLRVGARVWTTGAGGRRVAARVLRVGHVPAPPGHTFVQLRLADGRTLLASPGHPTADGRRLGELSVGDTLGGSRVSEVARVPARDSATWDLLPAGASATYWANGILLRSTLAPAATPGH